MSTSRLVLTNSKFFDPIDGDYVENQVIIAENRVISWVGNMSDFEKNETDVILDQTGNYILPGLIDCHVHLSADFKQIQNWQSSMMRLKDPMYSYIALKESQKYLESGFTTLRDCGGHPWGASLRRAFHQNMFTGPRLLVAQNTIAQWGNQEAMGPSEYIEAQRKDEVISGPDGVKHAVRERKRSGSDFIKTMTTGGVLHGMESKVGRSLWTQDELKAMVDEADRLGMHVAAHAHGNEGIYQATLAGVRSIEHCSMPSEETLQLMKQKNTYLVATHSPEFLIANEEVAKNLPPEIVVKGKEVLAKRTEAHKLAFEMGIKIALGTDAPVGRDHCHSATELTLMVKNLGVSPADAIKMATINASEAINLADQVGTIAKNKFADFVILSQDPLQDVQVIENKENIVSVIKDGRVVSQKGILIH